MIIKASHPDFVDKELTVRFDGLFFRPSLLCLGRVVPKCVDGKYIVVNDQERKVVVKFRQVFADPIPVLVIESNDFYLLPRLKWYEYALILSPISLLAIGGALGGGVGVVSSYLNGLLYRKNINKPFLRCFLPLLSTFAALLIFVVISIILMP